MSKSQWYGSSLAFARPWLSCQTLKAQEVHFNYTSTPSTHCCSTIPPCFFSQIHLGFQTMQAARPSNGSLCKQLASLLEVARLHFNMDESLRRQHTCIQPSLGCKLRNFCSQSTARANPKHPRHWMQKVKRQASVLGS